MTNNNIQVSDSVRSLAYDDLLHAVIHSNRNLERKQYMSKSLLKSADQVRSLVENTEESIYSYNGYSMQKYIESILTLLIFLNDKTVSNDSILFRMLLNSDLDDLYTTSSELLFPEILYSDIKPSSKEEIINNIINGITNCVPNIIYDYVNGQHYVHCKKIRYSISSTTKDKIKTYRKLHMKNIVQQIQDKPPDDLISIGSNASSRVSSRVSSTRSSNFSQSLLSTISKKMSESGSYFGRLFGTGSSSDEGYQSDYSSIPIDMDSYGINDLYDEGSSRSSSRSSSRPLKSNRSDVSSSYQFKTLFDDSSDSDMDNVSFASRRTNKSTKSNVSNKSNISIKSNKSNKSNRSEQLCHHCNIEKLDRSYRTIEYTDETPIERNFCGIQCMEDWHPEEQ